MESFHFSGLLVKFLKLSKGSCPRLNESTRILFIVCIAERCSATVSTSPFLVPPHGEGVRTHKEDEDCDLVRIWCGLPTQSHGNTWHCQVTSFNLFIRDLGQVISIFSCKKHKFQTLSKKKRLSSYLFSHRGLPTEQRTCTYIRELSQFLRIKGEISNGWPKAVTLLEIVSQIKNE